MQTGPEKQNDIYNLVERKLGEIEEELKRLGRWQESPLPPEKFENMGAFGMNTMTIEQWIQFVLVPRVHQIIEEKGQFPSSQLSVYATRNLDGDNDSAKLLDLIIEFDAVVNGNREN